MSREEVLLWTSAALAAAGALWLAYRSLALRLARRRARSFRPPAPSELRWEPSGYQSAAHSMPVRLSEHIRASAEEAARQAASSGGAEPANPYPPGTREFVLWVASYHLAASHLADEAMPPPAGQPAAGPGISPP
jgi:hypothetical protein